MSFLEIFAPASRHQREERDRQNTMVTYPSSGAAGPLGIDLESGKATIDMPARPDGDAAAEPELPGESQGSVEPA